MCVCVCVLCVCVHVNKGTCKIQQLNIINKENTNGFVYQQAYNWDDGNVKTWLLELYCAWEFYL